jgi:hypothetical protein
MKGRSVPKPGAPKRVPGATTRAANWRPADRLVSALPRFGTARLRNLSPRNIRRSDSPFGGMRNKNNNHDGTKVLPMC